jgi:O-antigen chain-terminating methyltransferase
MSECSIEDLLARLERERLDADRRYNDALTAVDRALQPVPQLSETSTAAAHQPVGGDAGWRKAIAALTADLQREFAALARFQSLLVQYLQTITAYVDTKDRSLGGSELRDRMAIVEQRTMAIKRELDRRVEAGLDDLPAEASRSRHSNVDASTYVGFEDRFRGSRDEIRGRVEDYLPMLTPAVDVVDVGCGRGELLDLLAANGIPARGVDSNESMVALCRSRGLQVEQGDAVSYLERQADGSLGGVVAVQVVEHFEPAYLVRFLETAYQKMKPGAPLVLETLNPACWMAFFECYIRDLTHQRPLHPDTLRYLVSASGFTQVDVQYRQPVRDADRLERVVLPADPVPRADVASVAAALNAHADKLNARLFSTMDYAVIARR